jgi:hypothetical protein
MDTRVILAILAVLILVIGAIWWTMRKKKPTYTYVAQPPADVWDPSAKGAYTCPGTSLPGYCILPSASAAEAVCDADPKCTGFITPAAGIYSGWGQPVGSVQLVPVAPNDSGWHWPGTVYSKKTQA